MLLTKPDAIKFDSTRDIVDYVSKGLPPTKKNYTALMNSVHAPTANAAETKNGEVFIDEQLFINCDKETFEAVLDQIYENRIRNRNIAIGIGAAAVVGLVFGIHKHNEKENEDED